MAKITGTAEQVPGDYLVRPLGELSTAGSTDKQQVNGLSTHLFAVTCSDYSADVVFTIQGSLDGTNWFNLDADSANQTVTADGTNAYNRSNVPLEYVRITYVSGTGTINTKYVGVR